jgi:hypothetical protein
MRELLPHWALRAAIALIARAVEPVSVRRTVPVPQPLLVRTQSVVTGRPAVVDAEIGLIRPDRGQRD